MIRRLKNRDLQNSLVAYANRPQAEPFSRVPALPGGGLECYLDASFVESYPRSGSTWFDLSGNGRSFSWSTASFTENGGLSYFSTLNNTATGPASNAMGLSASGDYTIIVVAYNNNVVYNNAIRFFKDGGVESAQRAFSLHLPWADSTIYWDQGGCCNSDTRTNVSISGNASGVYRMWTFRKGTDGRKIFRGPTLLTTNTNAPASISPNSSPVLINYIATGLGNWDARIVSFIVYSRAIQDSELAYIYWLFQRRGLSN